ncbi:MAG: hypothetical protein HUU35_02445 [Armatimonadetes bacterium]|nr:hypothetical protein [Armatimonadota bacterium]
MKLQWRLVLLAAPLLVMVGCGGNDEDKEGLSEEETRAAAAVRGVYHDWESVELNNGLVKVAVVPALGGRTMGYEFNGQALLYANPTLYGRTPGSPTGNRAAWVPATGSASGGTAEPVASVQPTDGEASPTEQAPKLDAPVERDTTPDVPGGGLAEPPAGGAANQALAVGASDARPAMGESEEVASAPLSPSLETEPLRYIPSPTTEDYRNYGGQAVWPAPRSHWPVAWPPPATLDLGVYEAETPRSDGDLVEVSLASPKDEALGLQLRRTLSLTRGSTLLRIASVLTNVGEAPRVWALTDVSQHPGALAAGETFTKDVQLFLPLAGTSRHHLGYAALLGSPTSPQYAPADGLLRVEYQGAEAMAGSDDHRGWIAYGDRRHELVVAKLAALEPTATYPDGGLTSAVYTSPAEKESYVQMSLSSPLAQLAPGEPLSFTVYYGAAACPLPIVAASRAGVVSTPLQAEKLGDSVQLRGVFGTFHTGHAQVAFFDQQGALLARTEPVPVSPLQPYRLDTISVLPDGAVRAALLITNYRRVDIAELSDAPIKDLEPDKPEDLAIEPRPITAAGGAPAEPGTAPTATPMPAAAEPGEVKPTGRPPAAEPAKADGGASIGS